MSFVISRCGTKVELAVPLFLIDGFFYMCFWEG